MNKKYKLKGWVVFSVYAISIITIISSLYLVGKTLEGMIYSNESISYVYRGIIDDAVPVVSTTKSKKFIMPYQDEYDIEKLKNMVMEINATQVPKGDVLSDSVYIYQRKECALSL